MPKCSFVELDQLAVRYREVAKNKENAVMAYKFELAAEMRNEECVIFERVGLNKPSPDDTSRALREGIDEQIQFIGTIVSEHAAHPMRTRRCTEWRPKSVAGWFRLT